TFRTLVIADTHVFAPNLVNEFRFGMIGTNNKYIDGGQRGLNVISETGLQGLDGVPDDWGMPVVSITGFTTLTHNGNNRYFYHDRNRQFTDNMCWIHGRHSFKFGMDVRHQYPDVENIPLGLYGSFSFGTLFTGNSYADFLLGLPQTSSRAPAVPKVQKYETNWFFFAQDDFRVTPRLTLNLGLRYEYQQPLTESGGLLYNFDPQNGSLVAPTNKINQVNPLFNSHRADRHGIVCRVSGNGLPLHGHQQLRTALRLRVPAESERGLRGARRLRPLRHQCRQQSA